MLLRHFRYVTNNSLACPTDCVTLCTLDFLAARRWAGGAPEQPVKSVALRVTGRSEAVWRDWVNLRAVGCRSGREAVTLPAGNVCASLKARCLFNNVKVSLARRQDRGKSTRSSWCKNKTTVMMTTTRRKHLCRSDWTWRGLARVHRADTHAVKTTPTSLRSKHLNWAKGKEKSKRISTSACVRTRARQQTLLLPGHAFVSSLGYSIIQRMKTEEWTRGSGWQRQQLTSSSAWQPSIRVATRRMTLSFLFFFNLPH